MCSVNTFLCFYLRPLTTKPSQCGSYKTVLLLILHEQRHNTCTHAYRHARPRCCSGSCFSNWYDSAVSKHTNNSQTSLLRKAWEENTISIRLLTPLHRHFNNSVWRDEHLLFGWNAFDPGAVWWPEHIHILYTYAGLCLLCARSQLMADTHPICPKLSCKLSGGCTLMWPKAIRDSAHGHHRHTESIKGHTH